MFFLVCVTRTHSRPLDPLLPEQPISGNALKAVSRLWLLTHVLAVCAFICACAATSEWNDYAKILADAIEAAGGGDDDGVVTARRSKTAMSLGLFNASSKSFTKNVTNQYRKTARMAWGDR